MDAFKHSWSVVFTQAFIPTMEGKDTKSYLPISYIGGTFVSQRNWTTFRKETYTIYIAFKKLSYYLYNAIITIVCDHAPVCKFLSAHTLNSKVNNWGTEIVSMSHVTFKHIKDT